MKNMIFGLLIFGLTTQVYSQTIELPEAVISVNYKYLNAVNSDETPQPVKKLEDEVLNYRNTKKLSNLYNDPNETFQVSFYIPEGKVIADYNKKGEIIRTIEKYNNVKLPLIVMQAISKRFPNWGIIEDVYLVSYQNKKELFKQEYKIKIKNEDKIMTIKTDEKGTFL